MQESQLNLPPETRSGERATPRPRPHSLCGSDGIINFSSLSGGLISVHFYYISEFPLGFFSSSSASFTNSPEMPVLAGKPGTRGPIMQEVTLPGSWVMTVPGAEAGGQALLSQGHPRASPAGRSPGTSSPVANS